MDETSLTGSFLNNEIFLVANMLNNASASYKQQSRSEREKKTKTLGNLFIANPPSGINDSHPSILNHSFPWMLSLKCARGVSVEIRLFLHILHIPGWTNTWRTELNQKNIEKLKTSVTEMFPCVWKWIYSLRTENGLAKIRAQNCSISDPDV